MKKSKKRYKGKKKRQKQNKIKLIIASAVTAVCVFAVAMAFIFAPKPVDDKPAFFETESEFVNGIDVSHHNGDIDWQAVAKNVDFAIIRVGYMGYTEGNMAEDEQFKQNIKAANEAGIPTGVYFYSQAVTVREAEEEAEFVLDRISKFKVDLPVFIDYEYAFGKDGMHSGRLFDANLSPKQSASIINSFCKKINKNGYYAGVYASSSMLNNEIKTAALDKNTYIWVADYNSKVKYIGKYDLWQYTKTGSCDGVKSKYTDLNRWYIK